MPNAAHHRAQAELYRHIADVLSAPHDAEVARAAADRHLARAEQLEARQHRDDQREH